MYWVWECKLNSLACYLLNLLSISWGPALYLLSLMFTLKLWNFKCDWTAFSLTLIAMVGPGWILISLKYVLTYLQNIILHTAVTVFWIKEEEKKNAFSSIACNTNKQVSAYIHTCVHTNVAGVRLISLISSDEYSKKVVVTVLCVFFISKHIIKKEN